MDTTGEAHFSSIVRDFSKYGLVLISGIKQQPKELLIKTGLYDILGEDHFFEHTGEAIEYAINHLNKEKCLGCKHFAFRECASLSGVKQNMEEKRQVATS